MRLRILLLTRFLDGNRDSDVVIKIPVEGSIECSSNSSKGELGLSKNSKLNLSNFGGSSIDITKNAFFAESVDEHEAYDKDVEIWSWKRLESSLNYVLACILL